MRRRRWIWIILILLLLIGVGAGYYYYTNLLSQPVEVVEAAPAVAQVTRGNIVITSIGVGTLLPSRQVNLGFGASGTVAEINVQVGDRVTTGDVLATLNDTEIQLQVMQADLDLRQAELALEVVNGEVSTADIAAAQATLASAQSDYDVLTAPPSESDVAAARSELASAQAALNTLLEGLSRDEETTLIADLKTTEIALAVAQADYDRIAWRNNVGATSQATALQAATIAYEKALAQFNISAAGPTEEQISAARAGIAQAQSQLDNLLKGADVMAVTASEAKITEAQAQLDEVMNGPATGDLESAELAVEKAMHSLDSARLNLEGSTIVSPVDGVVTIVSAQPGEQAGTAAIITVADLSSAQIQFWVEEFEVANTVPGNSVDILFEAFPDFIYQGEVVRVEPTLVDVDGAAAVQAWGSIDLTQHPVNPLFGMNAEVEITAGEARNAVLAPIQALRELIPGQFAVFIVHEDGELELRPVEVGLRDFVNAEIRSGLDGNETVSTGDVATQ